MLLREINNFIEKVKIRVEKYSALKPDSDLFNKDVNDVNDVDPKERIIKIWVRAVYLQDNLKYNEPSDWYYPLRESLGAAYYRQENYDDAEKAFCKDLQIHECDYEKQEIHKMNGRSLFGLIKSIEAQFDKSTEVQLNQEVLHKKVPEKLKSEFEKAWKNATVKLSLETM